MTACHHFYRSSGIPRAADPTQPTQEALLGEGERSPGGGLSGAPGPLPILPRPLQMAYPPLSLHGVAFTCESVNPKAAAQGQVLPLNGGCLSWGMVPRGR